MNKFKLTANKISYLAIVLENVIPLIGYFFLKWDVKDILLFYILELTIYEIIMLPRIVIFAFVEGEKDDKNLFMKILISFLIISCHIFAFLLALTFMFQTAFAFTAETITLNEIIKDIVHFLRFNIIIVIFICIGYFYEFYRDYIKLKEYKILPAEFYEIEIYVFYIILITALALINGAGALLRLIKGGIGIYQLAMLLLIIIIKTKAQISMKKRKDKEYSDKKNKAET